MIALAAVSKNNVIGKDGGIPWKCKEDMRFFKRTTTGKTIVMGRKTFEKMPYLPDRRLIVFSSNKDGAIPIDSRTFWPFQITDNYKDVPNDAIICGGAEVYKLFLPLCDEFYLTEINDTVEGDVFLPAYRHLYYKWDIIEFGDYYRIFRYYDRIK